MANRQTLIDTYQSNPTLQSRYTQDQYLDLFGFGQTTTPTPPTTPPPAAPTPPVQNIIGQNLDQGGGGEGIQGLQQTFTTGAQPRGPKTDFNINPAAQLTGKGRIMEGSEMEKLYNEYNAAMQYQPGAAGTRNVPGNYALANRAGDFNEYLDLVGYQAPSKYFNEPSMMQKGITGIKDFFSGLGTPKVRGTLGTRLSNQPTLPLPAAIASWSMSPFNPESRNYNPNFVGQLNYLEGMDGINLKGKKDPYTGETIFTETSASMIGRDPGTGLLKYGPGSVLEGKNVISLAGTNNYQTALENYIEKMKGYKVKTDFQKAKIARAEKELKDYLDREQKKKEDKAKKKQKSDPNILSPNNPLIGKIDHTGAGSGHGSITRAPGSKGPKGTPTHSTRDDLMAKGGRVGVRSYFDDGGMVYLYDRQAMENGGSPMDDYKHYVLKSELSEKVIQLMDEEGYEFGEAVREAMRQGYENGGPTFSEEDFPFILRPEGGRPKPSLDYYDKYQDSPDDEYPIITIPMGKMMKKKTKKKKKKKDREDYSDGGRVYLYDRQD